MARVEVVSIRSSAPLRQWLLIVAIAAGLIGMHNLVGPASSDHDARQHAEEIAPIHLDVAGALVGTAARDAAPVDRVVDTRAETVGPAPVSASPCCPCMGGMAGHLCQAVLGADVLTVAKATLLAATTASPDATLLMAAGAVSTLPRRGPPSSGVRFAQLGVWRR